MSANIFLSHDSRDKALAKIIADTLSRITLHGLRVWYSSDTSSIGGVQIGSVWLDDIRTHLADSKAVVVLLTPISINRPWLYFESGFGAAVDTCDVVPVCVGINSLASVPFPLAMYQCYQLADYDSLRDFSARILERYEIRFDEDLCRHVLQQSVASLTNAMPPLEAESPRELTPQQMIEQQNERIDQRLRDMQESILSMDRNSRRKSRFRNYSVPFTLKFGGLTRTNYLEISPSTTVQDILDNVYYMIDTHVNAFSYLRSWLLTERKSNKNLILLEFADFVPAFHIFREGSEWDAYELERPYQVSDSADTDRWYRSLG